MLSGALLEFSKAKIKLIGGHTSQSFENSLGFALTGIKKNTAHLKAQNFWKKRGKQLFRLFLQNLSGLE